MKLIVDIREKKLIKLLEAFKNQFDFKKIDIEIKNLIKKMIGLKE